MLENIELYLDSVDLQDSRDFIYEEIYMKDHGEGNKMGQIRDRATMKIYDQFDQKETYKACWGYGLTTIFNGNNVEEYRAKGFEFEQENPKHKRNAFQAHRWYPNRGSSLQENMKFFMRKGWIEWYMKAQTLEGAKNAIDNWFLIFSWTNRCSWRKTDKAGEFVYTADWGGHLFPLVWYNSKWFLVPNSFGLDRWDNGYFVVPYADHKYLYSTYVVVDKDDTGILKDLQYQREIKEAIEKGITNGLNPNVPVTRAEASVMALRASKL